MDATPALTESMSRSSIRRLSSRQILWASVLAVWVGWEFFAAFDVYLKDVFPSSFFVLATLGSFLSTSAFYAHASTTMLEIVVAFLIGSSIGVAAGICMGAWRPLGQAAEPYVSALMATPRIIWFPVSLMIFGSGIGSKVALGAMGAFFPAVLYTYAGMLAVRPIYKNVATVFQISPAGMVTKVYIPSILRPVLIGSQIGLGVCITPILLAEMKSSSIGLGHLIMNYYINFQITEMYAVLTFVFVFIVVINFLMTRLIRFASKGTVLRHPEGHTE